jgi:hypothetical protein
MAVELGNISLDKLTRVSVAERARIVHHSVPGLAGDLAQVLGRPSVQVALEGIFFGRDAADRLKGVRDLYLAGEPVDFFADAVGDGYFAQVLISGLHVAERAGEPDQFTYSCELVEFVKPPEPAVADPLAGLDTGLLDEAAGFVDDVQDALEQVSQLTDLLANIPSFGDPTKRLSEMPTAFTTLAGGDTLSTLSGVRDLF